MDHTGKFTGLATVYHRFRPDYPEALFEWLIREGVLLFGSAVAEIGSGSGIFTRQLLEHGAGKVYAVEPNGEMRQQAESELGAQPGFCSVAGTAEATTLDEGSVTAVFAAQAFHWFEPAAFAAECRRILKSGGEVVLVWNHRDESSPLFAACAEVCRRCCPAFRGFSGGTRGTSPETVEGFFGDKPEERSFGYSFRLNREEFLGRQLSSSYAPRPGTANYQAFKDELSGIFERFAEGKTVAGPNDPRCCRGPCPSIK